MKRDFNIIVTNFDGTPLEKPVHKTNEKGLHVVDEKGQYVFSHIEPVKLKTVLFELLGGRFKGDDTISGQQLMARYAVAMKIKAAGDGATDLDTEDTKAIKEVLEKGAAPLVYGVTMKLIEEDPAPPAAATQ